MNALSRTLIHCAWVVYALFAAPNRWAATVAIAASVLIPVLLVPVARGGRS